jgi:hypothetical protein
MRMNLWISGAIIVLVALLWLLPQLGHKSLWPDEAFYAKIAGESPGTILFAARNDFHPPGFLLVQHVMVSVLGSGQYALRVLSGLAWLGIVILTWLWGSKVLGPKIGLAAGLTAALSYFGLITATNATSYSLFGALSVATLFAFWWAVEGNGGIKAWILYAIAQTACVYTHHFGWGTFLAVNLYFLITSKERKKLWVPWFLSNIAVILLYLPLLSTTLHQLSLRTEMVARARPGGEGLRKVIQRLAGIFYHLGAGYVFHGPHWGRVLVNPLFWVTVVIVFGMVIGGIIVLLSKSGDLPATKIALFLGLFLVINVAGMVKSQADVLTFPNLAPVFLLLAASAAVKWMESGRRAFWWVALIPLWMVNIVGYGLFSSTAAPIIFSFTDFHAVAKRIAAESKPGDLVMTDLQKTGTPVFQYYYPGKFIARDHFDQYRYEFCIPGLEDGRFHPTTILTDDLNDAFTKGIPAVWYLTRYGLGRSIREQADEAIRVFPSEVWDDGELLVVQFYPPER